MKLLAILCNSLTCELVGSEHPIVHRRISLHLVHRHSEQSIAADSQRLSTSTHCSIKLNITFIWTVSVVQW
jgi:hypothetical protein